MTLFRLRFKKLGGHTHVRVFAGKTWFALASCGTLIFENKEWADFVAELNHHLARPGSIEILEDEILEEKAGGKK